MLQVKTFDEAALRQAALTLAAQVQRDFAPDVVVGIRTGGYIVAQHMLPHFAKPPQFFAISRQRASTRKKNLLSFLLKALPYSITNLLRIAEHAAFSRRAPQMAVVDISEIASLRGASASILVVDDAVDSGATLEAAMCALRELTNNACVIKAAAVTVTTTTPLTQPDYALYRHVLCRFPWSFDFKR